MRVKICGVKTEADVQVVVRSDADAAGFLVGQVHPSPDFILPSTAGRLARELPPYISPVLVTHLREADAIKDIVEKSSIFNIQLHGGCSVEELVKLRKFLPASKLVLAAHLAGNQPNPQLEDYYALIDAFIIDSYNKEKGQIGGTGNVHDWNVTKKIVADCPLPIFLAGGLNPDNVENAISIVNPYGVDANSGLRGEDGGRSFDRCKHFVRNAKMAKFSTRNDEA